MRNEKSEMKNAQSPRVAIVHDWLYGGGAEKVVEQLHKIYPDAPIYTSYCTPEWQKRLDNKVITGYLNWWPFVKARKFFPILRMWWFSGLDLSDYDLVISSSGNGEAKFARASKRGSKHICYCHTPPHYLYRKYQDYLKNPGLGKFNFLARIGLKVLAGPLRKKDYAAAQKVDYFIANSSHIKADIKKYYGVRSTVIFPPVDTTRFEKVMHPNKPTGKPNFVVWGRHVPDKRLDLSILACAQLDYKLTIVGSGPETENLKKLAGPTVKFVGWTSDEEMVGYASRADGFIFTSLDDFGIAPVEALAAGLPVIAYKAGGALDYVVNGQTGLFFDQQTVESLVGVLRNFDPRIFDSGNIKSFAQRFSEEKFRTSLKSFVNDKINKE